MVVFKSKLRTLGFAACTVSMAMTLPARADWPERAVTIVVPYAAGGITDVLARLTAERLNSALKQAVVIENAVGASGAVAAMRVKRAEPDGYTLFFATTSQISIAPVLQKVAYDPVKDFMPVSAIATSPFVVTVGKAVPVNSLIELIAYAKANPGLLTYGSAGTATQTHMTTALFAKSAGLDLVHVPYRGVGPAFQDLLAGHIAMLSATPVELKPFLGDGGLKPLAVSDIRRSRALPDLPTISEIVETPRVTTWNGILVAAGTPRPIIDRLSSEIMTAQQDPAFTSKLDRIGVDSILHTPAEFTTLVNDEVERWRVILREHDIKATN